MKTGNRNCDQFLTYISIDGRKVLQAATSPDWCITDCQGCQTFQKYILFCRNASLSIFWRIHVNYIVPCRRRNKFNDDIMPWIQFLCYWTFVRGIHRSHHEARATSLLCKRFYYYYYYWYHIIIIIIVNVIVIVIIIIIIIIIITITLRILLKVILLVTIRLLSMWNILFFS